jgi:spermidine synthase
VNRNLQKTLFALFFISGFCGLLYQVIWVRLAFASFGIITPVLSVVISVFMLGLCLGSWSGGRMIKPLTRRLNLSPLYCYALAEGVIGLGALVVPLLFGAGEKLLFTAGQADSLAYLFYSALILAGAIFPWCFFMGTTFPLMMAFVEDKGPSNTRSFSFLYLANVLGALLGTLLTAFLLIELFGFHQTLWLAGSLNFLIALTSVILAWQAGPPRIQTAEETLQNGIITTAPAVSAFSKTILFLTGFTSLGMEVAWTRAFTPIMGTQVYVFAILLAAYLLATWLGSQMYRRHIARGMVRHTGILLALLAFLAFLPIVLNDPRLIPGGGRKDLRIFLVVVSIFPFCAMLGYLTPKLIDEYAGGNPRQAGYAYALNIFGCILGPLVSSYFLLPWLGAQMTLLGLGVPFLLFLLIYWKHIPSKWRWNTGLTAAAFFFLGAFVNTSYEEPASNREPFRLQRDHTATVIARGGGMQKRLLVNGQGMTGMTQITKFMAHLPLAFHQGSPASAMVICFGMGTTYRSMLCWNVQTTAVELVPSVVNSFDYYFADAPAFLKNPKGKIVIDDGRRYLKRQDEQYDVITIDPPPPVETAGASLLYSEEFYALIKQRLKPLGILQQWYPVGKPGNLAAVVRSLKNSFPHLRVYGSVEQWGFHFLASSSPIPDLTSDMILSRMPEAARLDILEWSPKNNIEADFQLLLSRQTTIGQLLNPDPRIRISDDRPFNEYFWLRQTLHRPICTSVSWQ